MTDGQAIDGGGGGAREERTLRDVIGRVVDRFVAEGLDRDPAAIADEVMALPDLKPTGRLRYVAAHAQIRAEVRDLLREVNGAPAVPVAPISQTANPINVVQLKKQRRKAPEQLTLWPDPRAKLLQKSYPTRDHVWVPLSVWKEDDWRSHVIALMSENEGRARHIDALVGYGEWQGWELEPPREAEPAV